MRWLVLILVGAGTLFWLTRGTPRVEDKKTEVAVVRSHPPSHTPAKPVAEAKSPRPKAQIPPKPEFKAKFDLVESLFQDKRRDTALELLQEILRQDPNNERALYELGFFLGEDPSKREEAVGYLAKALEVNPENAAAMGELLALAENGGTEKTLAFVREQYDRRPDSSNLAAGLGRMMIDQGDYSSAILLLEKSSADPYFALSSLNSLLEAYRGNGDSEKMARTYERLISVQEEFMSKASPEEAVLYRQELEQSRLALARLLSEES